MHIFSQFLIHVRIPLNYSKHTCSLIFNASLFSIRKIKKKKKRIKFLNLYISYKDNVCHHLQFQNPPWNIPNSNYPMLSLCLV